MKIKKIHFIGIGGIGMSSLAFFLNKKFTLTGSDIGLSPIIKKLRKLGVDINIGHSTKNINNQDLIVYSSAINKSNVELVEAKKEISPQFQEARLWVNLQRIRKISA